MPSPPEAVDNKTIERQNLTLLKVYTLYRIVLCLALLTAVLGSGPNFVGSLNPVQARATTGVYLVLNLVMLLVILPRQLPLGNRQLFSNFLLDILCLILIIDASAGLDSNLGVLLAVVIAAGSMMLPARLIYLLAAIASLLLLADALWLIARQVTGIKTIVPAGILGMVLFITALLIQSLAERIRRVQLIAEQRAEDVNRLVSLNENIVRRMRTGILVSDDEGRIQLSNSAAGDLLGIAELKHDGQQTDSAMLPATLLARLQNWQQQPRYHSDPFRLQDSGPELQASFSAVEDGRGHSNLIFLEDNQRLAQQAQQIKLASLGRLTASIAHEIRNPLGAISHAAQLLDESEHLDDGDRRLSDIIQTQCNRMNQVIENVLQLSRRGNPDPQTVQLSDWLQQFIKDFRALEDAESNIRLQCDSDGEVTVDCSQLNQVITNLAVNGIRYSLQRTGQPTLLFHLHTHGVTGLPVLDIIDDGPGVAEADTDKLFEPFFTTEAKGSGLGLYISRELCEANQARLDYLRTEQGKSCFRIHFPHADRRLLP